MDIENMIPMDEPIEDFMVHLSSHPQTILSAKYGDGKSVFLEEFNKRAEDYTIITLFPVNYQVVDNKDIFELIKRDILFQMLSKSMIEEDYEVDNNVAAYFFLRNNKLELGDDILSYLASIDLVGEKAKNAITAYYGIKLFSSLLNKFNEFKNKYSKDEIINSFFSKIDENSIIEEDIITRIIKDNIKKYRETTGKKIAIVFEDMDRIDPAHIFRIMNVLSAHIDYAYKYGISTKDSIAGNKFDVDNIIVVLDYESLKEMFIHFYGSKSAFEGYINKFSPKGYFRYSLKNYKTQYYYKKIVEVTGIEDKLMLKLMLSDIISNTDLRHLSNACDNVKQQILPKANCKIGDKTITLSSQILSLIVILRRLNFSDEEIKKSLKESINGEYLYELCSVAFLEYYNVDLEFPCGLYIEKRPSNYDEICAMSIFDNGNAEIELTNLMGGNPNCCVNRDFFIDSLFKYISQ